MDIIPAWLTTPALLAAISALVGSVIPILLKVIQVWVSRRDSTRLVIKLNDGSKVSLEAGAVDEAMVLKFLNAVKTANSGQKGEPHE